MTISVTPRQEQILGYTLLGFGVVLTSWRLIVRNQHGHMGLDDLAALIAALAQVSLMIATNLYTSETIRTLSLRAKFFYWTATSYYIIIWASRLSILLSISRIAPTYRTIRFCRLAAIGYIIIWIGLNIQLFFICERDTSWKQNNPPQCPLGHTIAFTQIAVDVVADAVIIIVPARFFWRASLPIHKRIRLIAVFAISIITTLIGFSHLYFILYGPPLVENLNGILQCSISVIASNVPVVLASSIRICRRTTNTSQKPEVTKGSTVQFAGLSTLEGRTHQSHISGLTGLTGLTHITTQDDDEGFRQIWEAAILGETSTEESQETSKDSRETDIEKQVSQSEAQFFRSCITISHSNTL